MDHFFPVAGPPEVHMLDGWSLLSYAAGRTNRIKLGTMVTGITYRHPALLVKTATTLDVLSYGRASFGIGATPESAAQDQQTVLSPPLQSTY